MRKRIVLFFLCELKIYLVVVDAFRKFYAELISTDHPDRQRQFNIEILIEKEQKNLTFLAHFFDSCWRGDEILKEALEKVNS
jgi:hypothetical protein